MTMDYCLFITAPRSPPQNVMVSSSSSNSIVLSWQLPPVEGRNGIIIGYVVNYSNELHLTSGMVNSTVTSVTLDNLHEFEMYEIAVAAVTEAGVGPFSVAISVQTAEAGKKIHSLLTKQYKLPQHTKTICSSLDTLHIFPTLTT